ncbi:hypothetical protein ES676_01845 [Bizionia saleffrena]|uniref:PorT family protein n=1 Tax=Bizionia saleffrena TaxID=291189 RepID=A0A8H2QFD3_9FLAO|nr:hypothetical protein [Bizionia saleffrena]TYB77986.1 hypothetical protein ES676_01845 [Bizionia saleffrena]
MHTIIKHVTVLILLCCGLQLYAQDTIKNPEKDKAIHSLESLKESIRAEERDALRIEVKTVNERVLHKEISYKEAEHLKEAAAIKRALNIENRIRITENRMEYFERNKTDTISFEDSKNMFSVTIGAGEKGLKIKGKSKPIKYDIRTGNQFLFAIGLNNAIIEGQDFSDSPYKVGGSGFVELGWLWNTRLFKHTNFARIKYGLSLQWNKYEIKDNNYFEDNDKVTTLEDFSYNLKKAKFRTTSLVIPVHFEFGPSQKIEKKDRIRYINNDTFKIGLGGFAGANIGTIQKLKYEENGDAIKHKTKRDFNTNTFIYGLSGYIGYDDFSVYIKYNLSETFKNQEVKQNNISLGLRLDLD